LRPHAVSFVVDRWTSIDFLLSPCLRPQFPGARATRTRDADSQARLFGDEERLAEILAASEPAQAKKLGRRVKPFDDVRWKAERRDIVTAGNHAKFSQNARLRDFLLGTGRQVLVEASPMDRIWGIGMSAKDPRASDPRQWQGHNLLGFALMDVRERLREDG
ncbi:MAG: NADAR family protein, partial [Acidobacteriota bacterium]